MGALAFIRKQRGVYIVCTVSLQGPRGARWQRLLKRLGTVHRGRGYRGWHAYRDQGRWRWAGVGKTREEAAMLLTRPARRRRR